MNILLINKFLYPKGGDAISTLTTGKLLAKKGHKVYFWGMKHPNNPKYEFEEFFVEHIDYNKRMSAKENLKIVSKIFYSFEAKKKIKFLLDKINIDLVHLNNFAHQISPSILDEIKKHNIPTVMTMRDYKMVCPTYSMLNNGKVCEKCKNGKYYNCLIYKCTKNSFIKSFINTFEMYFHHKFLNIYDKIDIYISPSQFLLDKVKEMGFKWEVVYLPNFVDLEDYQPSYDWEEDSIVYVGRLSYEKGITTLINAVKNLNITLKLIGDGPLKYKLLSMIKNERLNNIKLVGFKKGGDLKNEIKRSMFSILPSEWYENNPRSIIESFALGKPVIGARIGGIPELINEGENGLLFTPRNVNDLRNKILIMLQNKNSIPEMGRNARLFVEKRFNPDVHYKALTEIYYRAISKSKTN